MKKPVNIELLRRSRAKLDGGAERVRTDDPHNAIVVLYQLSYDPNQKGNFKSPAQKVKTFFLWTMFQVAVMPSPVKRNRSLRSKHLPRYWGEKRAGPVACNY